MPKIIRGEEKVKKALAPAERKREAPSTKKMMAGMYGSKSK